MTEHHLTELPELSDWEDYPYNTQEYSDFVSAVLDSARRNDMAASERALKKWMDQSGNDFRPEHDVWIVVGAFQGEKINSQRMSNSQLVNFSKFKNNV